jgi:hypothetical protein
VRFKTLKDLSRAAPLEFRLASLPQEIFITDYAKAKAFAVSELVRRVHGEAFEWYGFTLAARARPEVIVDVGLPENTENLETYTSLSPERIAAFQETLPEGRIINGWVHSHGELEYRDFSPVDDLNQATVLDYVTSLLRVPVAQKEVVIRDLALKMLEDEGDQDLGQESVHSPGNALPAPASVTLLTDVPVERVKLLETVYGGFCFAIVIGDAGWTTQEIHYKTRGVLTGETLVSQQPADLTLVTTGKIITDSDLEALELEVKERIRPVTHQPENIERM